MGEGALMALRWQRVSGGSWSPRDGWYARTSHGTFALYEVPSGVALDYTSATQPAGSVNLASFGKASEGEAAAMRRAKKYAEEYGRSMRWHPSTGVAHLVHARRHGSRSRGSRFGDVHPLFPRLVVYLVKLTMEPSRQALYRIRASLQPNYGAGWRNVWNQEVRGVSAARATWREVGSELKERYHAKVDFAHGGER